ncbi:hypothetical protein COO60DRAFT_1182034 [Scenedesmus sp. NREL 46B-D3]|nr:hypothetical protein COO60DRAFT_1182034 [Scenedesmus sp. NREL 46B-D3]
MSLKTHTQTTLHCNTRASRQRCRASNKPCNKSQPRWPPCQTLQVLQEKKHDFEGQQNCNNITSSCLASGLMVWSCIGCWPEVVNTATLTPAGVSCHLTSLCASCSLRSSDCQNRPKGKHPSSMPCIVAVHPRALPGCLKRPQQRGPKPSLSKSVQPAVRQQEVPEGHSRSKRGIAAQSRTLHIQQWCRCCAWMIKYTHCTGPLTQNMTHTE